MLSELHIIGCGGHARSVADIILENRPEIKLTFYDESAKQGECIFTDFCVRKRNELPRDIKNTYFVAIGDNIKRKEEYLIICNYKILSVISKRSSLSPFSKIGDGCFVADYTHIGPEAYIGYNCIINTGAIIEHECRIGNHCHISVGAKICGRTRVGDGVMIGAGATVIDKLYICNDVIIGAGAVVVSDIYEPGTYLGVPAIKKSND